jgi:hypothetical protein
MWYTGKSIKSATARGILGPHLPPGMKLDESADARNSDSESDDVVGPMPPPEGTSGNSCWQDHLNDQTLKMKRKLTGQVI